MFGFLRKKKPPSDRDGVFADLRQAASALESADPATRIKVGMTLNIASTAFAGTFKDTSGFRSMSRKHQLEYMAKLKGAEQQARDKKDSAAALGFGLFNIWLCGLAMNNDELMNEIQPVLATLSREADAIQSAL